MVVECAIVVPEFLAIDSVSDAEKECLVLEVGLIRKSNTEVEAIKTVMVMLSSDIIIKVGNNLGGGLPIIKSESSDHGFVEGQVLDSDDADEVLAV